MANLALLTALILPSLTARRYGRLAGTGGLAGPRVAGGPTEVTTAAGGEPEAGDLDDGVLPATLYERVVRVVSFMFIAAGLVAVSLSTTAAQPLTYVLLAVAAFAVVLAQDVLPLSLLGRWRYAIEAMAAITFISLLVVVTGGHQSLFFVGYLLLLAGASLWAVGAVSVILAIVASTAYLAAVNLAPDAAPLGADAFGVIAFNLIVLALVSYVAAVIGREQRRVRESALRIARLDVLTGLHNRAFAQAALEREVLRAARTSRPFSLLMIDLDDLKVVNDRYGHESGDRLLRAVAETIRSGIRVTDVAARFGGDEFIVVLPDTDLQGALRVGEKLRFDVSRLALRHNGEVLGTSASLGLVSYPDDGRSSAELMRRVDMAMYEAKRRGRNQLVRFAREEDRAGVMSSPEGAAGMPADVAPTPSPGGLARPPGGPATIPIERPLETPGQAQPPAPWETRGE